MGPYATWLYSAVPLIASYGPVLAPSGVYYTGAFDMSRFAQIMVVAMTGPGIYSISPSIVIQLQYSNQPSGGTWINIPAAPNGTTATVTLTVANSQASLALKGESLAGLSTALGASRYIRARITVTGIGSGAGVDTAVYIHGSDARFESALQYQLASVIGNSIYTTSQGASSSAT